MWTFVEVLFVKMNFIEVRSVGIVSVVSIISSHVTTESAIILPIYLPLLQLHFAGFEK